jgi:polar amino acid transport system substrate-binding protein
VWAFRYSEKGLVAGGNKLTFEPLGVALPEDTLLINWVQNFMIMLKGTGALEQLTKKWFENAGWVSELP